MSYSINTVKKKNFLSSFRCHLEKTIDSTPAAPNTGNMVDMALHIDGLVQDRSNSIANAMELLQSCSKPSI